MSDDLLRECELDKKACSIKLRPCCKTEPHELFKSCRDYRVMCLICGESTAYYRYLYEAKEAWNEGLTFHDAGIYERRERDKKGEA